MNARKNTIVKSSFALASFAMCGAFVMFGGACGSGGTTPGNSDEVTFKDGKAQGPMTGYAYIALGIQNAASSPVCAEDPNDVTKTRLITAPDANTCDKPGATCPITGRTVWNSSSALCITGTIPKVQGTDYTSDWGLQIAMNSSSPPADSSGNGRTLGTTYSTITYDITPEAITPTNNAVRAVIHLVSQLCYADPYCATIPASGAVLNLTDFNTECWNGPACTTVACKQLTAADVPNIDKVGVQISSDTGNVYTVNNFCLNNIKFGK
ncbi:MAG TPA: hypothetical protein VJ860_19080 [Polyangia bacterium]|jgi:hypothetical protein|nr:hypothetical protein [Polyangia bacterium]